MSKRTKKESESKAEAESLSESEVKAEPEEASESEAEAESEAEVESEAPAEKKRFIDFSIRFKYEKKRTTIYLAVALVVSIIMYVLSGMSTPFQIAILVGFLLAYGLIHCLTIRLDARLSWIWTLIMFIGGAVLTTFSIQFVILSDYDFTRTKFLKLFINFVCVLAIYLGVQIFTNNSGATCIITHSVLMTFAYIDYFVYQFRGNEFIFADLRSMGTGISVMGNYTIRFNYRGVYGIFILALYIALVRKLYVKFKHPWYMRLFAALGIAVCVIIVAYNSIGVATETWQQKGTYKNGYVLNFILSIRDSFVKQPDGYSAAAIEELEEQYEQETATASAQSLDGVDPDVTEPTIIAIMNESFADLSVIGDLETNMPLTPFMDSLTENTTKGYALSSVFGAKTPNSEWEFLTGNSMAFLPEGSVVYQQYISKTPTTLVSTLKNLGYTCVAMHPYYSTGWSRNKVYPNIGFDEMYFIDDFDQTNIIRDYITDEELYSKIIERYEQSREDDEKLFLFGITMQNHGGYTQTYDNFEEDYYKVGKSYTDANQYFSLVHESDEAFEYLIDYFSEVDDPVEIVFFGDHQPSLTSKFYPLLNGKGLSGLTTEENEALYTVPFIIWTNYDTPEETVDITSLDFLSTMALERANIELPAYNQFLADMMEVVPAINSQGYYSLTAGTYLTLDEAEGEEAEWISRYRILQYNSMFDKKGRSSFFFPYLTDIAS